MLEDILDGFPLTMPVNVKQIRTGHINQTFQLLNTDGYFALQSLHPIFPDESLEDMHAVTDFLSNQGMRVPKLIKTNREEFFTRDHNNLRWRLYSWIDGWVYECIKDPDMAVEAGKIVAHMHKLLAKCPYKVTARFENFHDTEIILQKLEAVVDLLPTDTQSCARSLLGEGREILFEDESLPSQNIHGDLKISNIVFDNSNRAIGIIDFDTLLFKPRAIDMGDALRSWCNRLPEDDLNSRFDEELFQAAMQGYRQAYDPAVNESSIHRQAAKLIGYELAARFFIDMVTDNYFTYDTERYPSRKAHNRARGLAQYYLANSIQL